MAPPRKHDTDRILDAARTIALRDGPRATSVAAIAEESGAPAGTLYHRFGSRDRVLQAAWLRALARFHGEVLGAADDPDPVEAGVAMAAAAIRFARAQLDDARLLAVVRRRDLLDAGADPDFEAQLAAMNAPLDAALDGIAHALGHPGARAREVAIAAVVDLPGGAIRRHARDGAAIPPWLEGVVATNARRVLTPEG
jgi:AcrR family transcriptional regulator